MRGETRLTMRRHSTKPRILLRNLFSLVQASTCLKQGGNQGSRFLFMAQYRQVMTGDGGSALPKHLTFLGGPGPASTDTVF